MQIGTYQLASTRTLPGDQPYHVPSSIGAFINTAGYPCRSPITRWVGHPEIGVHRLWPPHIIYARSPSPSVQYQHPKSVSDYQVPVLCACTPALALSRPGFSAPINQWKQTLQRLPVTFPPTSVPKLPSPVTRRDPTEPSGSGLTPPRRLSG